MEKKRLVGIVCLLFGAILSIAVIADEYPSLEKDSVTSFKDNSLGLNYTYALGVGVDDDTNKAGCLDGDDASNYPETMQIYQKIDSKNILLDVYGHAKETLYNTNPGDDYCPIGSLCHFETCKWQLPFSSPKTGGGCYFLANEHDSGKGTAYSNAPDDCSGWIMPVETTLPSITQTTPKASGKEILEASGGSFTEDSFPKYFIETENLLRGTWDSIGDNPASSDAACMMSKLFPSNTKSFLCMNATKKENFVWYICDSAHTGKFIKSNDGMNAFFCEAGPPLRWMKKPLGCDSEGIDCDKEAGKEICASKYGAPLDDTENPGSAWNEQAKAEEQNKCCGDDGLDDLGKISGDGTKICFNEQITAKDTQYLIQSEIEQINKNVKENFNEGWKWISASKGDFKIRTVVSPHPAELITLAYTRDFLSNGAKWYPCNEKTAGLLKKDAESSVGDQMKASRFFCLGTLGFGYWKECITAEEQKQNNDYSRQVLFGENLLTLYPPESPPEGALVSSNGQEVAEGGMAQYNVKASTVPNSLRIVFKFTEDPFLKLTIEDISPKIVLSGISQKSDFIGDNMLDYAAVPYLENEVPLSIYLPSSGEPTIISPFAVQIKKVYGLGSGNNLFCSGKEEFGEGKSSWIADLDESPKLTEGKTACEANGFTWTGTTCCGDDAVKITESLDFYANDGTVIGVDEEGKSIFDETKPKGCWAGVPLKEGEAIGEIKFTISAGGKTLEETYPCKKETGKECRYFIKGIVGEDKVIEKVKLANLYPERYELTAKPSNKLGENQNLKDIKITNEGIEVDRNKYYLEAKNVPAMAIVGKDEEGNPKFLTCGADLSGMGTDLAQNMPLCAISGDNYCSPQGWTNKAPAKFNFNPETKEYEQEPDETPYEPAVFDHSSSIVFGRNLIPNAQWEMIDKKIKDWHQGSLVSVLSSENNKLTITGTDSIKSPFFYLEEKMYSLSFNSDCKVDNTLFVSVINKKGEKIKLSLSQQTGNQYSFSVSPSAEEYQIELIPTGMCNIANLSLYLLPPTFSEVPFNYDALHQPITAQQCCPENTCWNGFTCAEDMSLQTEREETVAEGVSYRCLKGNWVAQEKKWDWANKVKGYCEKETQCFVAPITPTGDAQGATAGVAAKEFYDGGVTPSCINDTEFIFDHYCKEGEWTTRTKFLVESLQSLAQKNDYPKYTIYCSPYTETLNDYGSSDDKEQFIGGGESYTKILPGGCTFTPNDPACQTTGKLCFGGADKNLVPDEENTCVNNFCLLTREEDKQQKTIFAVSLNRPIDDTSFSFLHSLGIEIPEEIKSACPIEGNDWMDCEIKIENAFLKYHPKLNLVAYSSTKFDFEPGTLAKIWMGVKDTVGGAIDFIGGLLGFEVDQIEPGQLPSPLKDKLTTTAFTTCPGIDTSRYFSFFGEGKSAVACVWNNTLSASYYNFVTPVCDFAEHTLKEKQWWLAEEPHEGKELPLQGELSLFCDSQNKNLIIKDPNDIAFWWPQLTGRLRIN